MSDWQRDVQTAYDRVAAEYAGRIYDELAGKPFDRAILDRFAALAGPLGPLCDLGCGPGQVARYLRDHARQPEPEVFGIDLSPEMVAEARRRNPDLRFEQGTMLALDLADGQLGGIAAFYSIVNVPRARPAPRLRRVLAGACAGRAPAGGVPRRHGRRPPGRVVGIPVSVDFYFFDPAEIEARLTAAGFTIDESHVREPYPDVEHPSRRAYLLARKPLSLSLWAVGWGPMVG